MTLEHYKAQEETARQFKELQDQLAASRALCERLQAQADEMRGGRVDTELRTKITEALEDYWEQLPSVFMVRILSVLAPTPTNGVSHG